VMVIGSWRSKEVAASAEFKLVQEGDRCSCFLLVQGYWSRWSLCIKTSFVIHPSSYPISMLKELFNKLLTTNIMLHNYLGTLSDTMKFIQDDTACNFFSC
jgi:hypothetical protein